MPFDGLTALQGIIAPPANTLASLGIMPVSRDLAEQHKRRVLREYAALSRYNAAMVKDGSYRWVRTKGIKTRNFSDVERMLTKPDYRMTPDHSAAPQAIVDLARVVHTNIRDAEFSVEYFYNDPILNVSYKRGDVVYDECLGIWDHGKVIAIAFTDALLELPVRWNWQFGRLEIVLLAIATNSLLFAF